MVAVLLCADCRSKPPPGVVYHTIIPGAILNPGICERCGKTARVMSYGIDKSIVGPIPDDPGLDDTTDPANFYWRYDRE